MPEFETTPQGCRVATSIGGVLTGRGIDITIIDDPFKLEEAVSKPQLSPPTIAVEFHNIAVLGIAMNQRIALRCAVTRNIASKPIRITRRRATERMRAIAVVRDTVMVDGPERHRADARKALAGVLEVWAPDIRVRTT